MKFIFDEIELVKFIQHVNAIITGDVSFEDRTKWSNYTTWSTIVDAVVQANKERILSKVQDYTTSIKR